MYLHLAEEMAWYEVHDGVTALTFPFVTLDILFCRKYIFK